MSEDPRFKLEQATEYLEEGRKQFGLLLASPGGELVGKLWELDQNTLRKIVFERVVAKRSGEPFDREPKVEEEAGDGSGG